ncbi:unnamed protein product (macronuclear) [Paramecium tetraurelia]|uniref:GMP phosphodiesterase delta subunit domain-containing protein n=1 Tax=Paramecium tetraurelia TaxID=5888 RepID=A0DKM0_PARTE|nr:uncharacterized protein GSPATT00017917001 [Paramecium tetraurelia]CAK83587.1 unnamed protein product [Paramecium tetraurelia]|eukprot:XP_001450984.1 hypothetical protein (macronuclear) [Paramecium tetraurelia strain d4-2]
MKFYICYHIILLIITKKFEYERHYFRDHLLRCYEFQFPFCIPNSTNTWEYIYKIPEIDETIHQEMIDNPFETKSDSFYFVGDQLVMQNKAEYDYSE